MTKVVTRKLNPLQKKIAKSFCDFAMRKFMPRKCDSITIRIHGSDTLFKDEYVYADVIYEESHCPRDFKVRIDTTIDNETFIRSLAHECVHIKQWAKGEMKQYERDYKMTRWHKQKINHERVKYYDQPWEIEAHGREQGLYFEFIDCNEDLRGLIDGTTTDYKLFGSKQMVFKFNR